MRSIKNYVLLFLKGVGMGSADVVPGVSGGTIAFITGIYEELLDSIKGVDLEALKLLLSFKIKDFWQKINGNFLAVLFLGIAVAVVTLSRLVLYLLKNEAILLWSFFFGLILASSWVVAKTIKKWNILTIISGIVGISVAYCVTVVSPATTPDSLLFVFFCGTLAICAMILPGISGSFILVLLGKYEYIMHALKGLKIEVILTFMAGCLVGILSFSRLLSYMLKKHFDHTVALLAGFMIGSLNKVYPWKKILERDHKGKPLFTENVSPQAYTEITGQDAQLVLAIVLVIVGFTLVYALERFSSKHSTEEV